MIKAALILIFVLVSGSLQAGEVEIVKVVFSKKGDTWLVNTTLRHGDTGWKHYADAWRVVDEKGKEIGTRVLFHPHVNEQPFTRSINDLRIPNGVTVVYVEARDKQHGWSKKRVKVDLSKSSGDRYEIK